MMLDELPKCPYCGHNVFIRTKKSGTTWNNELRKSITTYHHYVGCNTCFMRGPLMHNDADAIVAFEKLIGRIK